MYNAALCRIDCRKLLIFSFLFSEYCWPVSSRAVRSGMLLADTGSGAARRRFTR